MQSVTGPWFTAFTQASRSVAEAPTVQRLFRRVVKSLRTFPRTLVVEDDPLDALLLNVSFQKAGLNETVRFVGGGLEAIEYLRGKQLSHTSASTTLPELLLLSLKMPGVTGFSVLEWIIAHPHLRPPWIIVLGSSASAEDATRARALGADHYLVKPCDEESMDLVVQTIRELAGLPADPIRVPRAREHHGAVASPAV